MGVRPLNGASANYTIIVSTIQCGGVIIIIMPESIKYDPQIIVSQNSYIFMINFIFNFTLN